MAWLHRLRTLPSSFFRRRASRILLGAAALALLVYIGICAVLFARQRSLIYFPHLNPAASEAGTMKLTVDGTPVLVHTSQRERSNAVIYFGGNADNAANSLAPLSAAFPDRALFSLNYRSFGQTPGTPTESALVADALALFDQVHADHQDIIVVARSLGTGLAVHLASVRPVSRLVLITPYNSLLELAQQKYPYIPVAWLMLDRFESWRFAPQVKARTLVIAAEHDEEIPRSSTTDLMARFPPGLVTFEVISGTGHNSILDHPRFNALLSSVR